MIISSYEYDPMCNEFQDWNGTDCIANYTRYCESLTEQYREKIGNDDLTVSYNGSACVVQYTTIQNVEKIEYVVVDLGENQTITETKLLDPFVEYLKLPRKSQVFINCLTLFVCLALVGYCVLDRIQKKKNNKKKKEL